MKGTWVFPGCPRAPEWRLDWPSILARFPVLAPLAACRQDPVYHQEGDVLTHTRAVCQSLIDGDRWPLLDEVSRSVVFGAALLHDLGKPARTQEEEDGRLSAWGHAATGAKLVRRFLYRGVGLEGAPPALVQREQVVGLVRHHGLPLQWLERKEPERHAIEATLLVPGGWLAMLARADVRGRSCDDQAELLERVELFEDLCRNGGCLDGPPFFPSAHTRFLYLNGKRQSPGVKAYDASRFEVTMMAGLPGAGKDTWILEHGLGLPVVSLDEVRERLGVKPTENQGHVVDEARAEARKLLRRGKAFIWNATNLSRAVRGPLVKLFHNYGARVRVVYVEAPYAVLLRRNGQRDRPIPEDALEGLIDRLEPPTVTEAQRVEWIAC